MYLEMHSSWLSRLQTYEGCWVPVSGPASPATGCVPLYHCCQPESSPGAKTHGGREERHSEHSALSPTTYAAPLFEGKT